MNDLEKLKLQLKDQAAANLGVALQKLGKLIQPGSDFADDLRVLTSGFRKHERDVIRGVIDRDTDSRQQAIFFDRTQRFIELLTEDILQPDFYVRDEFYERILVVCKDKTRQEYLLQFFPREYFPNLKFATGKEAVNTDDQEIIVFDAMFKPSEGKPEGWDQLLRHYLVHAEGYLLFLGSYHQALTEFPEKAYATNSVFSIYARLRELSEFIKYYHPNQ